MCTNNRIHKTLHIGGEIYSDIHKIWRSNVSILCMLLKYLQSVATCINMKKLEGD